MDLPTCKGLVKGAEQMEFVGQRCPYSQGMMPKLARGTGKKKEVKRLIRSKKSSRRWCARARMGDGRTMNLEWGVGNMRCYHNSLKSRSLLNKQYSWTSWLYLFFNAALLRYRFLSHKSNVHFLKWLNVKRECFILMAGGESPEQSMRVQQPGAYQKWKLLRTTV